MDIVELVQKNLSSIPRHELFGLFNDYVLDAYGMDAELAFSDEECKKEFKEYLDGAVEGEIFFEAEGSYYYSDEVEELIGTQYN
jgi:hypothetical protein